MCCGFQTIVLLAFSRMQKEQKQNIFWCRVLKGKQSIYFEKFNDYDSFINKVCNIVTPNLKCEEIQYSIRFLSCSSQLTQSDKLKIIRKHKSTMQKRLLSDKDKEYRNLDPAKKNIKTEKVALNYKSMDHLKKKALLETNAKKYKSMKSNKKEVHLMKMRTNMKNKYEAMDVLKEAKHLENVNRQIEKLDLQRTIPRCMIWMIIYRRFKIK